MILVADSSRDDFGFIELHRLVLVSSVSLYARSGTHSTTFAEPDARALQHHTGPTLAFEYPGHKFLPSCRMIAAR
jgi:hypothetical protein